MAGAGALDAVLKNPLAKLGLYATESALNQKLETGKISYIQVAYDVATSFVSSKISDKIESKYKSKRSKKDYIKS